MYNTPMIDHWNNQAMEKIMQEFWDKQTPVMQELYKGVGAYMASKDQLQDAFREKGEIIRIAGSGILLGASRAFEIFSSAEKEDFFACCIDERLVETQGGKILTSHEGCGAAALAYENLSQAEKATYANATEYAKAWTKQLVEKLPGVNYAHLSVEPARHIARAVIYDGSGRYDASQMREIMPYTFVVSRKRPASMGAKEAKDDLALAIAIAFGSHGFGERFQKGSELLVIPVAERDSSDLWIGALTQEIRDVLLPYGDKIKVDGFVAPAS